MRALVLSSSLSFVFSLKISVVRKSPIICVSLIFHSKIFQAFKFFLSTMPEEVEEVLGTPKTKGKQKRI